MEAQYSITDAVKLAKGHVDKLPALVITGEVTSWRGPYAGTGHCYFKLKDEETSIDVRIWRPNYHKNTAPLQEGAKIIAKGNFQVYQKTGELAFIISDYELAGEGYLRAQVEALFRRLVAEGLTQPKGREVPKFCETVAVVTSASGSVIDDVKRTLRRRNPLVKILVSPCKVQGEGAVPTIIRALKRAEAAHPDAILLVRGGGSYEELMTFNDESLARCVASLSVPVVTGIGHEPDRTICDEVADMRTSTPTHAAEAVAPTFTELAKVTNDRRHRLILHFRRHMESLAAELAKQESEVTKIVSTDFEKRNNWLEALASRPCLNDPFAQLHKQIDELNASEVRLTEAALRLQRFSREALSLKERLMAQSQKLYSSRLSTVSQLHERLCDIPKRLHQQEKRGISDIGLRLEFSLSKLLPEKVAELVKQKESLTKIATGLHADELSFLRSAKEDLEAIGSRFSKSYEADLKSHAGQLEALSPLKVIARGYAIVKDESGHVKTKAQQLKAKDQISIQMQDASVTAEVISIEAN